MGRALVTIQPQSTDTPDGSNQSQTSSNHSVHRLRIEQDLDFGLNHEQDEVPVSRTRVPP